MTAPGASTTNDSTRASDPMRAFVASTVATWANSPTITSLRYGVRSDPRATLDHAVTLQDRARQQRDLGRQFDVGVDVGVERAPDHDAAVQPLLVDPSAQHRLGAGQLHQVIDAGRFGGVLQQQRLRDVAGLVQHGDEVGQVVLVLGVLSTDAAQRRAEQARAHDHDRRVDLGDQPLVGTRVALLDDARDPAVLRVHDASVARRVLDLGGQDGQGRLALAVHVEQSRDRARSQQRRVAGQDQDVAVARAEFVVDRRQRHRDRVAGAQLLALLDEDQVDVGAGPLGEGLLDPRGAVTDDDDRRAHVLLDGGVQDVEHHRASAEVVQRLGAGRLHPRSLARGEHDDTGWTTHTHIFIRFTLRFQP